MDAAPDIREFLTSRRERISPEAAGVPARGGDRRVKGLHREEAAVLAWVGVDRTTRLERGRLAGVSRSVLERLARALQLDEAGTAHLHDLARTAAETPGTIHTAEPGFAGTDALRILGTVQATTSADAANLAG